MAIKACWVEVSKAERAELEAWLRSATIAQGLAKRARIVVGSANGESIRELAAWLEVSGPTVSLWRRRFGELGIAGLRSRARSGRRRPISSAQERAVVGATMRRPQSATHWSARRPAKEVGLSPATVHRIWQKYGLQPHRVSAQTPAPAVSRENPKQQSLASLAR
jgi:transposase